MVLLKSGQSVQCFKFISFVFFVYLPVFNLFPIFPTNAYLTLTSHGATKLALGMLVSYSTGSLLN